MENEFNSIQTDRHKEAKGSHKEGSQKGTSTKKSKSVTKQKSKGDSKTGKSSKNKDVKESTDSTQASGAGAKEKGDSTAKTTKTQSKLSKTVKQVPVETTVDHSVLETLEVFDLTDNEAWAGLPSEQIPERFIQYRWLTTKKLKELDEQLKLMTLRTQRKKWNLSNHNSKNIKSNGRSLQVAAEKEADAVMTQLEDFINEQEKMDTQENIDSLNVGEESQCPVNIESKTLDLPCENFQEDLHRALPEAKEIATTTCVSDTAISVENSSTTESHSSKPSNFKVPDPVILPDQKSAIPSASDLSTNEGNEILPEEELCPKMKDTNTEVAGMPFQQPQELQGISEDDIGDGDKNLHPVSQNNGTEDSIKVDTDSTMNNQMYKIIMQFKENLTKLISHKDMKNDQEILVDIDSIIKEDNTNKGTETHSDELFKRIQQTFKDITQLIYDQFQQQQVQQLTNEKGYPSLDSESLPTDSQRQNLPSMTSEKSTSPNKIAMRELMDLYNQLQSQIIEDTQKHEAEQRHNSLVMIEMQDKITSLQEQLELARKIQRDSAKQYAPYNYPVMFTRLDLERNAKIMTRALASQHISDDRYKDIIQQMADYISLPVLRFQQLVHRYVHHCRLKQIYGYIKQQSEINYLRGGANIKETYQLQKVVNVHNQYVNHWCEQATVMSMERQSQASALTETLEDLEAESGLFLIKPIYTNRIKLVSREKKVQKKRNTCNKLPSNPSHLKQTSSANSADTLFDQNSKINIALNSCNFQPQRLKDESNNFLSPTCNKQRHTSTPIWASSFQSNLKNTAEGEYIHDSIPKTTTEAASVIAYGSMLTAPRILELDINRMLIGQNNVSIQINPPTADESQQLNLRSYISVCRPTATPGNICSGQPFSNITSSCYELKTPPVSRLCTPKPNNGEQFVQTDQLPNKLQLERISFPPISSHVTTQTSVGHDNYLTSK
ncbi:unnamed protein product [Acanthosepion pharaonis]|uniref:Uncharacterized protein n=1 Tax=Acanthosepion pharaonis TaxID=158019 RepID=A0A812DBA0_ACAPH|nr:unnamed protein product [Sepia pharaonis]